MIDEHENIKIEIMRILTLPVDDFIADGYNNAAPIEKTKINSAINMLLEKILKNKQDAALSNAMDALGDEASKNGLTIEKLGELMEWDEDTMKNLFGKDYRNAK
jgi:hypothetical protein